MNASRLRVPTHGTNASRAQGALLPNFSNTSHSLAVFPYGRQLETEMQDISQTMRNIFLVGLISLGASIAGCTVVEDDDDADVQLQDDDLDDEDVEVEIDD